MNAVNRDGITLLDVAESLVALAELGPKNGEQLLAGWIASWAEIGVPVSREATQVSGSALWSRVGGLMSHYISFLTPEQQAQFVLANLPSLAAAENFRRCLTALADRSSDAKSAQVLRDACDAAELLTSDRLSAALGVFGGLDFTDASES